MRRRSAILVLAVSVVAFAGLAVWRGLGGRGGRSEATRPIAAPEEVAPSAPAEPTSAAGTLVVEVVDGRGAPLAAIDVLLTAPGRAAVVQPTDATGVAAFAGRTERELEVWIASPDAHGARLPAGRFAPARGDARLKFVLRPPRRLVLEVSCDGKRQLPEAWLLGEPSLLDAVIDPEAGTVAGRFHPTRADGRVRVLFHAAQYLDGGADLVLAAEREPVVARIELVTGSTLVARALGDLGLVRELRAEREAADGSAWHEATIGGFEETEDGQFSCSFRVAPGNYRFVLASSGVIVGDTTVRRGDPERPLALDLAGAGWCDVHVATPEGCEPGWTRLVVTGDRVTGPPAPKGRAGEYRLFVPGDRTLAVRATHPLLVPAGDGGTATLVPGGSVVLNMVPGPLLRFRFPGVGGIIAGVTLLRRHPGAEPVFRGDAVPADHDGSLGITGWEPGSYVMTVDPHEAVPVTVNVRLEPGGTHLGDLPFTRGSHVHVACRGVLELRVTATAGGIARYASGHEGAAELRGLAAGSWDLTIAAKGMEFRRAVHVDGTTDATLTLDAE